MHRTFYMPLTAVPFRNNKKYKEVLPRNQELAKYIRCFWGSEKPYIQGNEADISLVIPDTCADILYYIDHTENTVTGGFCGISDVSFRDCEETKPGHLVSLFAIRFYAWGAYIFAEDSLKGQDSAAAAIGSEFSGRTHRPCRRIFFRTIIRVQAEAGGGLCGGTDYFTERDHQFFGIGEAVLYQQQAVGKAFP